MKNLNATEVQQVSGGEFNLVITARIPDNMSGQATNAVQQLLSSPMMDMNMFSQQFAQMFMPMGGQQGQPATLTSIEFNNFS